MTVLVLPDLVRSARGKRGGFVLSKQPDRIRLNEVVQALGGPITLADFVDDPRLYNRYSLCVTKDIWERLKDAMLDILDSVTHQETCTKCKSKQS